MSSGLRRKLILFIVGFPRDPQQALFSQFGNNLLKKSMKPPLQGIMKSRLRMAYSDVRKAGLTHGKLTALDENMCGEVKPG